MPIRTLLLCSGYRSYNLNSTNSQFGVNWTQVIVWNVLKIDKWIAILNCCRRDQIMPFQSIKNLVCIFLSLRGIFHHKTSQAIFNFTWVLQFTWKMTSMKKCERILTSPFSLPSVRQWVPKMVFTSKIFINLETFKHKVF